MASDPVRQFDDQSMRRIAAAVRKVEQTPVMRQTLPTNPRSTQARVIRWGRTTTSYEHPTYPSAGPAYVVELGDYGLSPDPVYPGATVSKTFTPYDPAWTVIAVDPSGGTWAQGTVVRVERHGEQWWIRPTAGAATHPCLFQNFYTIPYSATGITKTSSPSFYTVAYSETLGSRTDNNCGRVDLGASGDPFLTISTTGSYRIVQQVAVSMASSGSTDTTVTSSGPSAGAAHTHTVTTYGGKELAMFYGVALEYRVGGSGSWTLVPESRVYQFIVNPIDAVDAMRSTVNYECFANLTSGWQIRQTVYPYQWGATANQLLYVEDAKTFLHYMGDTLTADTT